MKATGIVRKVDELGRVVIPIELRRTLGIAERDALEIYTDEDRIVLQKYERTDLLMHLLRQYGRRDFLQEPQHLQEVRERADDGSDVSGIRRMKKPAHPLKRVWAGFTLPAASDTRRGGSNGGASLPPAWLPSSAFPLP